MHRWIAVALFGLFLPAFAQANTIDRVRADGVLHCGGVIRPGVAWPARDDTWHGIDVDVCRAIAIAVLGDEARYEFHAYAIPRHYDAIRNGTDDVFFLTASEILAAGLLPSVLPGRPVFYATDGVIVPKDSPAQHVADLAGTLICGEPGTGPERTLTDWFAQHKLDLSFFPFQETEEMFDAYVSGRCGAMTATVTALAVFGLQADAQGHPSRLLPDVISAVPLMANTGRTDAAWASVVAWTVDTLLRAERAGKPGPGGGEDPLPIAGPAIGLDAGWQQRVLQEVGSYADIYERNLGSGSPLGLPRGLNALWMDGGIMCPPFTE